MNMSQNETKNKALQVTWIIIATYLIAHSITVLLNMVIK